MLRSTLQDAHATFLYRYTVRHEFFLLEGRLLAIEHLTSATCRMLSSQMSGYGRKWFWALVCINKINDTWLTDL